MTRVSENSSLSTVNYALNKTKAKLEDLQQRGTLLKKVSKISDDPSSNVEALKIMASTLDNNQYIRNANYATISLNHVERSLESITEALGRAKEIAIAQASDLYGSDVRKNIASEIAQIRNELLATANKRIGQRYIFGGHQSLSRPFDDDGHYQGDRGRVNIEVAKDFFVPINLNGYEVFASLHPENLSDSEENDFVKENSIFGKMDAFVVALENNDTGTIQDLIERFDQDITRIITLRTRVGSIVSSIEKTKNAIDIEKISQAERKSLLLDADVAELFSDIVKHQNVLKASYKASQTMLNQNLLDFL